MKQLLAFVFFSIICFQMLAQLSNASSGTIKRYDSFASKFVTARNVDVWLPEGYTAQKKYAVLYMQDGQMLFDSCTTWNHTAWDVDDVAAKLMKEGNVKDFIIVGAWNGGVSRHAEYFPQKPFQDLSAIQKDTITAQLQRAGKTTEVFKPVSDNYLKFLVTELKPFVDNAYSTLTKRENTFIAGSSMGGLISMYAICEYPKVFGGAACLSTHWPGVWSLENNPVPDAFLTYLKIHLPNPKNHKLYFDCGDQTLDSLYPVIQKKVDKILRSKGFTDKNWMTKYFPGENHTEQSWSKRVDIPLLFLLKK